MKKLAVVLILAGLACTASATILGTVNIQNHNNNLSDTGNLWGGGLSGGLYYTGVYSWTNAGGSGLGLQVPNWGFCIELTQEPYTGWQNVISLDAAPQPVTAVTPMGLTKTNYIRELWGRDFDPTWATGANRQMAEAFGACLWEIVYETDPTWDVTSSAGFHATIEQAATANLWLSQLNGDVSYFAWNLAATSSPDGQDYLVQLPEPATVALLSLGLLALRKRK
ncbi:MAG: PEP-CTERM sorting domain-containing protein [Sedimentisphaerales bacterium]